MNYDVKSYHLNTSDEAKWYFQYHFRSNGVTRLCPAVKEFKTKRDAEQAAREPVNVEHAEAYMERVLMSDGKITAIWYTVQAKDNVNRKRYAGIASTTQQPGDEYVVVAFKNETVRRAANVRAAEQGYKFCDMKRNQIGLQQANNAAVFDHSDQFRNYLRAQ